MIAEGRLEVTRSNCFHSLFLECTFFIFYSSHGFDFMSLLLLLLLFLFSISPPTVLPIQPVSSIPTAYCLTSLSSSCHYILLMLYISPTLNTEVFFFFLFIFVFVSPYFMYMFEQTNDMSKQTELMNTPEQ